MNGLSALRVKKLTEVGKHADSNGLTLQVASTKKGSIKKSWSVRFRLHGRQRQIGIGTYPEVSLAEARDLTRDIRSKAQKGIDPIAERKAIEQKRREEEAGGTTFRECAEKYIVNHEKGWANAKHRQQWRNTLAEYAYPVFGDTEVADIGIPEVMQVIEPLWFTKTETASRLRGRIENILGWAIVHNHRPLPNPAVWRGQLEHLLPKRSRVQKVTHHPALDWREMPDFILQLKSREGVSARALEFTILTAARSGEVRYARWNEIELADALWVVPEYRMKMRREHRVPLSRQSLQLLAARKSETNPADDDYIFYRDNPKKAYSDAVYRALFGRMKRTGITAHGFRSSFRDWAGEATNHDRETTEVALAHQIGNAVERSYRRGDALEKRRSLMQDWADYLDGNLSARR